MKRGRSAQHRQEGATDRSAGRAGGALRIVGGRFRGRILQDPGHPRTRPMKDRVREAVFNLIGPRVRGRAVLDLFAGTGALGLEAISRGAARAILVERHFPTARVIRQNVASLDAADRVEVVAGSAFFWVRRRLQPDPTPWLVFCCPPYDFYVDRWEELDDMIRRLWRLAAPESLLVVEADRRFDPQRLPEPGRWDVREYPPAVVALAHTPLDPD